MIQQTSEAMATNLNLLDDIITHEFQRKTFRFYNSKDMPELIPEIFGDNYHVLAEGIEFREGDVILDIGANEGVFSVMMSVLYPQVRVISYEPVPRTYAAFMRNIGLNPCPNVKSVNGGVGGPDREAATLFVSKDFSGGSTSLCTFNPEHHDKAAVPVVTLEEIFHAFGIDRCRLLKMDIEGMEYEALYPSEDQLLRTDYMAMEVHTNRRLEFESRRMDGLVTWCANRTKVIHAQLIRMAE